jgi:hypothetical protein
MLRPFTLPVRQVDLQPTAVVRDLRVLEDVCIITQVGFVQHCIRGRPDVEPAGGISYIDLQGLFTAELP